MTKPLSPYLAPGFYQTALARGRHRDIVGGRWDETGRLQLQLLQKAGLRPEHQLLDIGCGSLRLGCKAVPYLAPGHYWGTDQSGELMHHGLAAELPGSDRLSAAQLVEDAEFAFPGIPPTIQFAIAFAVFTHLPLDYLHRALTSARHRFPSLQMLLFTCFLAPSPSDAAKACRQPDGVVTHPHRPPYHFIADAVETLCAAAGFAAERQPDRLPRGQILFHARPTSG
ncbi:MAG: class I SAM-dependent methyltransferase [Paracoccaceae bacterium]